MKYRYFAQKFYILENFESDFLYIELWFPDKYSKPIEITDKIKIT